MVIGLSVLVAIIAFAHFPLVVLHVADIWSRPHYRFVPFLLPGVAILAIPKLRGSFEFRPGGVFAFVLIAVCWLELLFAIAFASPWLGMVAALSLMGTVLWMIGGKSLFRRLWPAWSLLWLAVPLPLDYDDSLISALQSYTARSASALLDEIGVIHVLVGNVLEADGRRFMIEEECSGAQSFFALVPFTIFFVLWTKRRVVLALMMIVAAAGWVLVANVARIVGVVLLTTRTEIDVSEGWQHQFFGLLVYVAAIALLLSTDRLLLFFASICDRQKSKYAVVRVRRLKSRPVVVDARRTAPRVHMAAGAMLFLVYGTLLAAQLLMLGSSLRQDRHALERKVQFDGLSADTLPSSFEGWTRVDYSTEHRTRGSESGEFSRIWRYRFRGRAAHISVDYPFTGWHELPHCYRTQGWTIETRMPVAASTSSRGEGMSIVYAKLTRPFGPNGYLLFALFDQAGRPVAPKEKFTPRHDFFERLVSRLESMQQQLALGNQIDALEDYVSTYQVQLFIASDAPLMPTEEQEAIRFLELSASRLRRSKAATPRQHANLDT